MATTLPIGAAPYVEPLAAWRVTLDGQDLTAKLAPLLISLSLDERLGEQADALSIVLDDSQRTLALPQEGAVLSVALGWERGTGVSPGLVDKGRFVVDEVEWSGPPDRISIRAHSADLGDSLRTRRNRVWHGQTIGTIVGQIAAEQGLTARCHPDLAGIAVTAIEQANKSDMQLLRDLGRRYDAVATVKAGALLFAPRDATTTATGKPIPSIVLTRAQGDGVTYSRAKREGGQDGAESQWHDQHAGRRHTVSAGGSRRRRLKRVYASEADANAAANSEHRRLARAKATLRITQAHGDAAITPGLNASASGFKAEVDGIRWRVTGTTHRMDGEGGFVTDIELEVSG